MTAKHPYVESNVLPQCKDNEYLTDRLTLEAEEFIEENMEQPFFVYLQHCAVHTPIEAKKELIKKYQSRTADTVKGHANAKVF